LKVSSLLTNILNPKAGIFYISVLPAFVDPKAADVAMQSFFLALLYVTTATLIHILIVVFADFAGKSLSSQGQVTIVRRFLAVGLVAVAVWFLLKT
jgi:threonine/homoserine/homoserine lactone efflux protein